MAPRSRGQPGEESARPSALQRGKWARRVLGRKAPAARLLDSAALQSSLVGAVVCLAFEQKTSDTMHKACGGFLLIPHCF